MTQAEGVQTMAEQGAGLPGDLLLILLASLAFVAACRPLRLPGTLGYFVAGALLGPGGGGFIDAHATISGLAELGIVLLLFSLGLEFSLPRLLAMRRAVFGLGTAQVLVTGAVFSATLYLAGLPSLVAVLIGAGMALSSTALVMRELESTGQLRQAHGQHALGILLFQDLIAVFLLILVPVAASGSADGLGLAALELLGAGILLALLLLGAGRYMLPVVLGEIARSRSSELFVLTALAVVMGAAWLTHAFGLSIALGGFLGGMMLGESTFRHQVASDIRPFRDLLLGIFLVSVGMMLDFSLVAEYWPRILAFGLILMLIKGVILLFVARAFGSDWPSSTRLALVLAQGGEFAFALLALSGVNGLISGEMQAFMVAVILVSMVLTPGMVRASGPITNRIVGGRVAREPESVDVAEPEHPDVLLVGYGRVGQAIGRLLNRCGIGYRALDMDGARVGVARLAGEPVRFGDGTREDILVGAGLAEVRLVVICLDDPIAVQRALASVRHRTATTPVLVRTQDDRDLEQLLDAGATEVVPETLESSFMLLSHATALLGVPRQLTQDVLEAVRGERYKLLHGVISAEEAQYREVVHPVILMASAWAVGKSCAECLIDHPAVTFRGVRRRGDLVNADELERLEAGDIAILVGPPRAVEAVEARLLAG